MAMPTTRHRPLPREAAAPAPVAVTHVAVPSGAPARIGATIGALERLLIVAFMLTGAEAAVGFVIAAKTIARFKQLDDRGFAEYYLLGTLASVAVAVSSSLVALGALGTLVLTPAAGPVAVRARAPATRTAALREMQQFAPDGHRHPGSAAPIWPTIRVSRHATGSRRAPALRLMAAGLARFASSGQRSPAG